MKLFEDNFLAVFPDTLFAAYDGAVGNFAVFAVILIVALEISRRLSPQGALIAFMAIVLSAVYVVATSTTLIF